MEFMGLAHIGIKIKDMDASIRFYTTLLGFELTGRQKLGTSELAFLQCGSCIVELIHPAVYEERTPGQIDHLALEVRHIEEIVENLKKNGVQMLGEIADCPNLLDGVRNIFFCGPDGERIELFDYVNRY